VLVVEITDDEQNETQQDWKRNIWGSKESGGISKVMKKSSVKGRKCSKYWRNGEINRQRYDKH
jgi:hypothetical protein